MGRANYYDAPPLNCRAFAFLDVGLRRWRWRGGLGAFDFLVAGILLADCGARGVQMPCRVQYRKTGAQPISKFMELSPGLCVVVWHNQEIGSCANISSCANFRQRSILLLTASYSSSVSSEIGRAHV